MEATPQAFLQGRSWRMIAEKEQASMHLPQRMHFSVSTCARPFTLLMAFLGQISMQGCSRQPWQPFVTLMTLSGQRLQANFTTFISGGS